MEEVDWSEFKWTDPAQREMLYKYQERQRALYVIEKAGVNNPVDYLVGHQVSKTLIEELTGTLPVFEKKVRENKDAKLREWVLAHLGEATSPWEISKSLGISYDTALNVVKNNPDYFVKIKKGSYTIRDGQAEREEAKASK